MIGSSGLRTSALAALALLASSVTGSPAAAQGGMSLMETPYIAALVDPNAKSGTGAENWGFWQLDPGPRGVKLTDYPKLEAAGGAAPAGWRFDNGDWWLEEHGLIMEAPVFPLAPGRYLVTGNRETTAVLTIHAKDGSGSQRWELSDGATVHDVTHLRCRASRYVPAAGGGTCSPQGAMGANFPIQPEGVMPPVENCTKQDYQVLIVRGIDLEE